MMYQMKNIVTFDSDIMLPKCMYNIRNPNEVILCENIADEMNIRTQVPNKKMAELEQRQDQLLGKLDILYDRIKTISSYCCQTAPQIDVKIKDSKQTILVPDEIVLALSPDNLPWYINLFLKESALALKVSWHIHSSVPNEKMPKIFAFVQKLKLKNTHKNVTGNLRLIFKNDLAGSELKLLSLFLPIVGNVNILRYLSYVYPNILHYDDTDNYMESLLDICHILERAPEKSKAAIINKLFAQSEDWIYKNQFSIIDVAVYNTVKQWQNSGKYVPKAWLDKCEKKCT